LPTIPGSTSNLSVDEQQAAATTAKRKEDDVAAVTQAAAAITHREQEALVATMVAAHKTLVEARACEPTAVLAWEKEKTIAHHLEQ
jgi:hypothetical protein